MFNKDFLFSAIKRVFAGDPIKFKFYLSYNIVAFKKIIALFSIFSFIPF